MKEERKLTWEEHLAALTSYLDEKGIDLAYKLARASGHCLP